MSISLGSQDYTAILEAQPGKIRALSRADFPKLTHYKKEWHRFLFQRGHELERQLQVDRSESEFATEMGRMLDWFWQDENKPEYDPAFLQALKESLIDIAVYYDSIEIIKPTMETLALDVVLGDLRETSSASLDHEPPSIKKHWAIATLDYLADKTSRSYEWTKDKVFGLAINTTYAFTAAVMIDIAFHHEEPDTSYTARAIAHLTQNKP